MKTAARNGIPMAAEPQHWSREPDFFFRNIYASHADVSEKETIRLEDERWAHIVEEHRELAGLRIEVLETVSEATRILRGSRDELLAVRMLDEQKALVVI